MLETYISVLDLPKQIEILNWISISNSKKSGQERRRISRTLLLLVLDYFRFVNLERHIKTKFRSKGGRAIELRAGVVSENGLDTASSRHFRQAVLFGQRKSKFQKKCPRRF